MGGSGFVGNDVGDMSNDYNDSIELTSSDPAPQLEGIDVEVYPNPVVDVLNVKYHIETEGSAIMTIVDVTGKVVYT